MQCRERTRLSVAVLLSLALVLLALAASAGAAKGRQTGRASPADEQYVQIWAYFDGDTPVSGGTVHVYANGKELTSDGRGPVRTFSHGEAMLRFHSLPSRLRIVVSGGRAGGRRVRGSLQAEVRGVSDGDLVQVNPVTTVTDMVAHADRLGLHHARDLTYRTLGIRTVLDNSDLYATDRWFDGRRFERWALKRGSVQAGARSLVQLIDRPGFDRRTFRPGDAGGSEARVAAACGTATAKEVIGGLLDAAAGAANLTGPQGFVMGTAVLVFKQFLGVVLPDCEHKASADDAVAEQLRGLSAQVAKLHEIVEKRFLEEQIAETKKWVTDIQATQVKFLSVLKWAADLAAAKSTDDREALRGPLRESTSEFMTSAKNNLVTGNVATHLDVALRVVQKGKDAKGNPFERLPLIHAVRVQLGEEHFWTNQSSKRLRGFFDYYQWVQVELATVLTEYYMAGGDCLVGWMNLHPAELPTIEKTKCPPLGKLVGTVVEGIQTSIQGQEATLPKDLSSRVIIDRSTHLMWRLEPTVSGNPEILKRGLAFQERAVDGRRGYYRYSLAHSISSFPDLTAELGLSGPWSIPTAAEYRDLFAKQNKPNEPSDEPLARLKQLGVSPKEGFFRGNPAGYLWVKGDFYEHTSGGTNPALS